MLGKYLQTNAQRSQILDRLSHEITSSENKKAIAVDERAKTLLRSRKQKKVYDKALAHIGVEKTLLCIGPGGRFHEAWKTVDKLYGENSWSSFRRTNDMVRPDIVWDALDQSPIPLADGSVRAAYCAHVIEHLTVPAVHHSLREICRLLSEDGVFRVACPDSDLFTRAYDRGDFLFFLEHEVIYASRLSPRVLEQCSDDELQELCAWVLLHTMSLVTHEENSTTICYGECADFIAKAGNAEAAVDKACDASDEALARSTGWHISWWNWQRLEQALRMAGFSTVRRSAYLQSEDPLFRSFAFFDRTDPHQTLFVEAML